MSFGGGSTGLQAIKALVGSQADFRAVADKDWAAAAGLIVRKLLISAGQTTESLTALRAAVGEDIFETQLKSLTHHQARQLARRLDKAVADLEVSTAGAAAAHVRTLLAPPPAPVTDEPELASASEVTPEPEPESETTADDPPPSPPNPYFGRKSFRAG